MKEVVKVNLAGVAFSFDNDAYTVISTYLSRLEDGYVNNPDGKEILSDIEARLAELILSEQDNNQVISKQLAEKVVGQLGFPDDMEQPSTPSSKIPHRLYRNPDGAKLGGVCSGLGAFFDIDAVWIRLLMFAPLILLPISGACHMHSIASFLGALVPVFFLLYIILWLAIPMAKTPRQKLEMRGEPITAESIHRNFTQEAAQISSSPKQQKGASAWANFIYIVGQILQFCVKALVAVFAVILCMTAIGIFVAIISLIVGGGAIVTSFLAPFMALQGITPVAYVIIAILLMLLPVGILIGLLIRFLFNRRTDAGRTTIVVLSVIWFILAVYFSVITVRNIPNMRATFNTTILNNDWWENEFDGKNLKINIDGQTINITADSVVNQVLPDQTTCPADSTDSTQVQSQEPMLKITSGKKRIILYD